MPCSQSLMVPIGMRKHAANCSWVKRKARRIIFARGVRFIRCKSAADSGCASGSARAAASISSSLIARIERRADLLSLLEIVITFTSPSSSSRNQTSASRALSVDHVQNRTFGEANDDEAVLLVVVAIIDRFDGMRVMDRLSGRVEPDAMLGEVFCGLRVVPLEFVVSHHTTVHP